MNTDELKYGLTTAERQSIVAKACKVFPPGMKRMEYAEILTRALLDEKHGTGVVSSNEVSR